ncbi:TPA: hypothetical protein UMV35_004036 [Stenotrophomonas maltophilia]|nr:hypothetical protein [Stenotrophomonas maltophilia]HEL3751695.1 hypothetical protein [Stenotrophomonas maltophilia]HEL7731343.1 hypothetical protein [Stenotrophomonas maltophilia]
MVSASNPPTEGLQPVVLLETAVPGVCLRASFDQRAMLYLALVHVETDAVLSISVHTSQSIRPAAGAGLQAAAVIYLLAGGEMDRFFFWLRAGGRPSKGAH